MRFLAFAMIAVVLACGYARAAEPGRRSMDIMVIVGNESRGEGISALPLPCSNQSGQPDQSCMMIAAKDVYSADGNISVPLFIYRGSTLKRTVYVWIENDSGGIISSKSKLSLPERFSYYSLSANISFKNCVQSGDYVIVAEGLGLNITKGVALDSGCSMTAQLPAGKVSFQVISSPASVKSGEMFKTVIIASNPTSEDLELDAWSYVYRSSVCYSGEREQNRKTINLPSFSNVTFELENTVNASAGDYTLKVKLLHSGRKTADELNMQVYVEGSVLYPATKQPLSLVTGNAVAVKNSSASSAVNEKRRLLDFNQSNASGIMYLSSSAKASKLAVYFIIIVLVLLLIIIIFKKL